MRLRSMLIVFLECSVLFVACGPQRPPPGPNYVAARSSGEAAVYVVAVHPLFNPAKLIQTYQPLMDQLNEQIEGVHFDLVASRDYATFEAKYARRETAVILPNPWQTLQAEKSGYHVVAMAGDPADFRGIILVRRDSGVRTPQDLKGKAVSYPASTALAACIMPQYFLHTQGLDIKNDLKNVYVGSQESSILSVVLGRTTACATWPPPWRIFQKEHPEMARDLVALWETEPLVNNSVMVRDDVPQAVATALRRVLVELSTTVRGREILEGMETASFTAADDHDYDVVRRYIDRFEAEVRSVETP